MSTGRPEVPPPRGPDLPELRFISYLAAGGYSDVFLYERERPRMNVAVKVARSEVLDAERLAQFADEAQVMAELNDHPYIVPVLSSGTAPDGRPYLVMKYYPPPDLGKRVADAPLSVADAVRTGIQLASAVETAHRAGILHRDIKPANVLMSSYDVPGLTDFGIAGRAADTTEDGDIGLSVPWAAPEVLTGRSNGSVQSDVYSLAATIWNLLVGRPPFAVPGGNNEDRAMFRRILHESAPVTGRADVPPELDRLLQRAMAKKPELRHVSVLDLARGLQRVEQQQRFPVTSIDVLEARAEAPVPAAPPAPAPVPAAFPGPVPQPEPDGGQQRTATVRRPVVARADRAPAAGPGPGMPPTPMPAGRPDAAWAADTLHKRATVARPHAAEPYQGEFAAAPAARRPVRALVAALTLLVVAAGVGWWTVSRGRDDDGRTAAASPGAGQQVEEPGTADLLPGSLEVPGPSAEVGAGRLTVSWARPADAVSGDRFEYIVYEAPDSPDLRAGGKLTQDDSLTVRTGHPQRTCVVVRYVHGANYSDWSPAVGGDDCG